MEVQHVELWCDEHRVVDVLEIEGLHAVRAQRPVKQALIRVQALFRIVRDADLGRYAVVHSSSNRYCELSEDASAARTDGRLACGAFRGFPCP